MSPVAKVQLLLGDNHRGGKSTEDKAKDQSAQGSSGENSALFKKGSVEKSVDVEKLISEVLGGLVLVRSLFVESFYKGTQLGT